ncbi:Hypothetical protein A7982_07354 [Minicystis rosea]|nr:Hypothetical protein A7982_07354 [Minicystis rosea]
MPAGAAKAGDPKRGPHAHDEEHGGPEPEAGFSFAGDAHVGRTLHQARCASWRDAEART